jgi:outer membrane protein
MRSFASTHAERTVQASMIEDVGRLPVASIERSTTFQRSRIGTSALFGCLAAAFMFASPAAAQPRKPAPAGQNGKPAPAAPTSAPAAGAGATPIPDMMAPVAGGITADQVGTRAAATSYQAKAAEESANAAAFRADAAVSQFIPRVQLKASYTRLSEFKAPVFNGISFPLIFDQFLTQAMLTVPISDYFLKINQNYTAATKQEEAARWDIVTAKAKSYSDGKIAYFNWLLARGQVTVTEQNLAVAQAHLKDAQNQFAVGNASRADVLRAETQVASATLLVERAKSAVVLTERQVRVATHAKEDEKFEPGESIDNVPPPPPPNARPLVSEAMGARPEIKSIDKNAESTRKLAEVQKANRYPVVSGFGEVTYANPNQRKFPITAEWFPTWSLGAQVTWSPNDLLVAGPQGNDLEAKAAALDAQKQITRDGIELEVTQAYQSVVTSDTAITTTTQQLTSAEEGYRVARELFNAGRGTATTLIDAENALATARFEHLQAKVDARLTRIRLEHAIGRDVKAGP